MPRKKSDFPRHDLLLTQSECHSLADEEVGVPLAQIKVIVLVWRSADVMLSSG